MATVKIFLRKDQKLKNGEHPIMLRIISNRKKKDLSLKISCKPELWDERTQRAKSRHPKALKLNKFLTDQQSKVEDIILELMSTQKVIGLEQIVEKLNLVNPSHGQSVFNFFQVHIDALYEEERVGNANAYEDTFRQLKKFRQGKDLSFYDITPTLLRKWEKWFDARGLKPSSISKYFRTLKALINHAIKQGVIHQSFQPFNEFPLAKFNRYKPEKRALTKVQLEALKAYEPNNKEEQLALDIFFFSYYTHGMNFTDIAHLKWKDIREETITYKRKKTGNYFKIKVPTAIDSILERQREMYQGDDSFIFNILSDFHQTARQKDDRIRKMNYYLNRSLRSISKTLEFGKPFTLYAARHTFATILYHGGISEAMIGEALGHASEKVTKQYLGSFDEETLNKKFDEVL